jgi:hypothetical protein
VRPEPVGPERRQCQQHTQPQPTEQSPTDLFGTAREHGIHGTDEVAEVVGGRNQTGGSQVDLTFAEQVRHLRCEGETPDPHGHHQGDKTGE